MNNSITLQIADISVGIDCNIHNYIREKCSEYIIYNDTPSLIVAPNMQIVTEMLLEGNDYFYSVFHAIFNSLANELPKYGRIVMHGACIKKEKKSVLISGNRGIGKSFIAQKMAGEDSKVNHDKGE